jgi:hypothetical protein
MMPCGILRGTFILQGDPFVPGKVRVLDFSKIMLSISFGFEYLQCHNYKTGQRAKESISYSEVICICEHIKCAGQNMDFTCRTAMDLMIASPTLGTNSQSIDFIEGKMDKLARCSMIWKSP